MDKQVAYSILTVKEISEERREISGMATTPDPDRVGDVVEPLGVQFKNPAPLLWQHNHDLPVGKVTFGKPTAKGVPFTAKLPRVTEPSGLKARIDEAWESVKNGLVTAVSIGFRPLEYSVIEETGGYRFTKTDVYELSLVTVPANSAATITAIKSFDREIRAAIGKEVDETSDINSGVTEKKLSKKVKLTPKEGVKMSITEKLKGFEAAYEAKKAEMQDMMQKSLEAGETFDGEQSEKFETLKAEAASLEKHISQAREFAALDVKTAKPIAGEDETKGLQARNVLKVKQPEKLEKGMGFTRIVMALGKAQGDHQKAFNIAKQHYGEDSEVARILEAQSKGADFHGMIKAAVQSGSTLTGNSATWGNELVTYNDYMNDFVEYLYPLTIIGQFGTDGKPALTRIPFNVRIPGQDGKAAAGWVGEGLAKPVTDMSFNAVELRWYKIACITVITEELIRFSNPSAERLVRESLAKAVIERMDIDFINPAKAAVAGVSPASILNGITPIPSVGTDADSINCDLQALETAFINADNPANAAVYIMQPRLANVLGRLQNPLGQSMFPGVSMRGGTLLGTPVIVSNYVPDGVVALVNASDIWLADDGQVTIDASREATIQMDNAPTQSSVTPTATTGVSMFQTNSVAIRAERYINWARRRDSAVAYLTGVAWSACAELPTS